MLLKRYFHLGISTFMGIFSLGLFLGVIHQAQASVAAQSMPAFTSAGQTYTVTQQSLYIPFAMRNYPLLSMFGVEPTVVLEQGHVVYSSTLGLTVRWVRLNDRISWRALQPEEGEAILWEKLADFEDELRVVKSAGMEPIVIIDDYPRWATDNTVRQDGLPTSCGRLLEDKVADFAVFVAELVNRYKTPEFGVRNWELGNEPDLDPDLVPADNMFGCWGDIDDPYYGGEAYGRMVIQAGGAIHAADPMAKVWIGGLLLDKPYTTDPNLGRPELFLEGILRSGAAPYFDIVPYHWYSSYGWQVVRDFDLLSSAWSTWGGGTVGRARYLRQLMQAYDVSKPVFLNETSFICPWDPVYPDRYAWCEFPTEDFYNLQASYIVRSTTRAFNEAVTGIVWYTMNGPGWRSGGLLDSVQSPKPVYRAYSQMISQYRNSLLIGPVTYAPGVEAYAFNRGSDYLHVLWAIQNETITVTVPISDWLGTYSEYGEVITPTMNVSGTDYALPVGFSPVYLVRRP